ncbi:MAG TPA: DNA-3-methyladenine glycosylase [Nitrososphaeraceae archaeon]|jgi:DNA-3-methyladenine glycosylase
MAPTVLDILDRTFYHQPTFYVAKNLLGKKLVRLLSGKSIHKLSGLIVETEAYGSTDDEASHAFRGKTSRNSMMFGPPGIVYMYLSYGIHFCLNITAYSNEQHAGAVLIRAIPPLEGIPTMKLLRGTNDRFQIASGPGRLTKAFDIGLNANGMDVTIPNSITVEGGITPRAILVSSRVGINKAKYKPWRYVIAEVDHTGLLTCSKYASMNR